MRKDLVVIPEDHPGVLADLGETLGAAGINIEAISAFTGRGKGVVHVLVDRADEAVEALNAKGVPTAPVYTAKDVFDDPQVAARGLLMPIDDPDVGTYRFARTAPMLESNTELPRNPAPALGQHTREVLLEIGYSEPEIETLAASGVVRLDGPVLLRGGRPS